MSEKNAQKTAHLSLLGILVSCFLSPGHLSWSECFRLVVLLVGLAYAYVKYRDQLYGSVKPARSVAAGILALLAMFSITQFDPATSGFALRSIQDRFNATFIATTLFILFASAAVLPAFRARLKWSQLTQLDRVVAIVVSVSVAFTLLSKAFIGRGITTDHVYGVVKLVSYALLWFMITRAYGSYWTSSGATTRGYSTYLYDEWKLPFVVVVCLFGSTSLYGGYRTAQVLTHLKSASHHFANQEWEAAETGFKTVAEMNETVDYRPAQDQVLADGAVLLLRNGRDPEARALFAEIRSRVSDPNITQRKVAEVYLRAERWREAADILRALLDETTEREQIIDRLGLALVKLGDSRGLIEVADRYSRVPSVNALSHAENIVMGNLSYRFGSFNEAVGYFTVANGLRPDDSYSEYKLGLAIHKTGNVNGALERYRRAVALDPEFADALSRIGVCLEEQGEAEEAERSYRKALDLLPNHSDARAALSRLQRQ
jgi:tetratricopeptide (TPR) repeat protein